MSLLIVVCETSMRASFALNMYEITHEVSLVLAFWCIGIEDSFRTGVSYGLFHK